MDARSSYINAVIDQLVTDHGVAVNESDETIRVGLEFKWGEGGASGVARSRAG